MSCDHKFRVEAFPLLKDKVVIPGWRRCCSECGITTEIGIDDGTRLFGGLIGHNEGIEAIEIMTKIVEHYKLTKNYLHL